MLLISAQSLQFSSMFPNVQTWCSIFMVTVNSSSALFHFSASASQNLNEEKCIVLVLTSYCSSGREEQIVFEALEDLTILCRGHCNWKASELLILVKIDQTHVLMRIIASWYSVLSVLLTTLTGNTFLEHCEWKHDYFPYQIVWSIYVFVSPHFTMPGAEATCALSLHFLILKVVEVVMEHVPIE